MQCPSCDFNNIPGSRACARCQSRLDLASVDFTPPRAADHAIPLRVRQVGWRICSLSDGAGLAQWLRLHFPSQVDSLRIACGIIPGWGHRRSGQQALGWLLTAVWLVLVLLAAYTRGGAFGWPAYFALVGWHGFTVSLLLIPVLRESSLPYRMFIGLSTWALLNLVMYMPAWWLVSRMIVPIPTHALMAARGIQPGDTVLRQGPWLRPHAYSRGDVVAYHVERFYGGGAYIHEGLLIDRIIGAPGDIVELADNRISVNGQRVEEVDLLPLRDNFPCGSATFTLRDGEYVIIPSTGRFTLQGMPAQRAAINGIARVPQDRILGRVIFRTRPIWRAGPMRWIDDTPQTPATGASP